ncbi:MAG: PQQ-binding-like beta-propeller repeat protein [Gemmataceae bacterium]
MLVGGPLALLALLFPAVFGGWKRWLVLLSTGGTISTLYFGQWWFAESLAGSWWGTPAALWTTITLAAVGGLAWAWNRHLFRVQIGEAPLLAGWVELAVLAGVSVLGGGLVVGLVWLQQPLLSMAWLPTVAFVVAVWIGTLYVGWTWLRGARLIPALATEAVVLLALAVVCVAVMPLLPGRTSAGGLEAGEQATAGGSTVELRWSFRLPDKGAIASSPLVVGDRVYVAAAHDSVFRPYGAVYCLERDTGKVVWSFSDGKKMKQVFSSPAVVGGKLYIGEGFHQDAECKVYCLDATKGTKVWEFQTESHTESTPAVVDGRVTIGGGDDGLFALDAATGAKVWHYPGYHIDAGATVRGERVYVGCGIGDTYRTTVLFCLDAAKGQPHWRVATELPVWSRPIVSGGFVFAGIGNGRLNEGDEHPAGAVLCVRAADGSEVWKQKMPDGVLGRLGADRRHLFFGCRDGSVYCLHRHDGSLAWRRDLGTPVVAGPALDVSAGLESLASRLVAVSVGGQLVCVEPATGKLLWSKDLVERTKVPVEVIATPALEPTYDLRGREGWRLYVGLTLVSSARVGELHCYQESAAETSQP